MKIVRTDGQQISGNAVLAQQLEIDSLVCRGETQKANMSGVTLSTGGLVQQTAQELQRERAANDVMTGCMAQKGYVLVPEHEAATQAAAFRANAEQSGKQPMRTAPLPDKPRS